MKKFENQVINEIESHMSTLGFSNKFIDYGSESVFLTSKHSKYPALGFVCNHSSKNMVSLVADWKLSKELICIEQYECLNWLASEVQISKIYVEKTPEGYYLSIRAYYIGTYYKEYFSEILDRFINDANKILNDKTFRKLFVQ